ncbi:hypothetical protein JI435_404400, partial [Parastagonospora nodorum SN15]
LRGMSHDGSVPFSLFHVYCDPSTVTAERNGFRNLIPQSAYRQRLFLCGSAYFRALLHTIPIRRLCRARTWTAGHAPSRRRHALRTFYASAFMLSMLLGEP